MALTDAKIKLPPIKAGGISPIGVISGGIAKYLIDTLKLTYLAFKFLCAFSLVGSEPWLCARIHLNLIDPYS